MEAAGFRQAVIEVLAERWNGGHRAIDSSLIRELLMRAGYFVSPAYLDTLLKEWEQQQLIQLGTVHEDGSIKPNSGTVIWISHTLLSSACGSPRTSRQLRLM